MNKSKTIRVYKDEENGVVSEYEINHLHFTVSCQASAKLIVGNKTYPQGAMGDNIQMPFMLNTQEDLDIAIKEYPFLADFIPKLLDSIVEKNKK